MYGQKLDPPPGETSVTIGGEDFSDLTLSPSSTVIGFDDLTIYRIGGGNSFALLVCLQFFRSVLCTFSYECSGCTFDAR